MPLVVILIWIFCHVLYCNLSSYVGFRNSVQCEGLAFFPGSPVRGESGNEASEWGESGKKASEW